MEVKYKDLSGWLKLAVWAGIITIAYWGIVLVAAIVVVLIE